MKNCLTQEVSTYLNQLSYVGMSLFVFYDKKCHGRRKKDADSAPAALGAASQRANTPLDKIDSTY